MEKFSEKINLENFLKMEKIFWKLFSENNFYRIFAQFFSLQICAENLVFFNFGK